MKKILTLATVLFLLSASTVFSQDLCDKYHDKYRVCVEAREAGSNLDYDDCATYTNAFACSINECYWNDQGLPAPGVCVVDFCLADSDISGRVTGADLTVLKKDLGRVSCPTTPDIPAKAPVEKTGWSGLFALCYDEYGTQRNCANTGEDGEHSKGVGWPFPRFVNNGDGTATDKVTGLTWLLDANCIATNYPGFDNDYNSGDGAVTWQHALDFVSGINGGTYPLCKAGYTDWRLPNIKELESLRDFSQYNPALPGWLTLIVINVQPNYYWSSTTYAGYTYYAWLVNMYSGNVHYDYKDYFFYVWPVRGGND